MRFVLILVALLAVCPLASCERASVPPPRVDAPAVPVADSALRVDAQPSSAVDAAPADEDTILQNPGSAPSAEVRAECDTIATLAAALLDRSERHVTADTTFREELMGATRRGCVVAVTGYRRAEQPGTFAVWRQLEQRGWPNSSRRGSDGSNSTSFILYRPSMICSFSIRGYDEEDPAALSDPGREWFLARCANEIPGDAENLAPDDPNTA